MNTHIYCDNCRAIKPLLVDEMRGKDVAGQFGKPTDLICGECRLVIATTYLLEETGDSQNRPEVCYSIARCLR